MNEKLVREAFNKADDAIVELGAALNELKTLRPPAHIYDSFQEKILKATALVLSYKTLKDLALNKDEN